MQGTGGCSRSLSRAGAAALAVAFALTLPVALVAFAWGNVLFSPSEMSDVIADELVDSGTLQQLAVDAMLQRSGGGQSDSAGALDYLARQDLDSIFAIAIPPGWARSQIGANLDNLYAWIDNQQPTPQITLEMQPVKQQIQAGGARQLVETVVSSWPECSPEQVAFYAQQGFSTSALPEVLCQPPESLRGSMTSAMVAAVERAVQELPNTVRADPGSTPNQGPENIAQLKRGLRLLRGLAQAGWMLPVSALGLITALAVRSWSQLMRWWGAALTGGGLLTFLSVFVSGSVVDRAGQSSRLAEMPFFFRPIVEGLIQRLLDTVSMRIMVLALVTTILGLVLLVPGLLIGRRAATDLSVPR